MGTSNIANLMGSSQAAGSLVPQHVLLVDANGAITVGTVSSFWAVEHNPNSNTQATITKAAPGTNKRLVCTQLTVTLVADATAPTPVTRTVALIDGASGGTTYLWRERFGLPAVAGAMNGACPPGQWIGTANTALTLEWASAGGANTFESVTMSGFVLDV